MAFSPQFVIEVLDLSCNLEPSQLSNFLKIYFKIVVDIQYSVNFGCTT